MRHITKALAGAMTALIMTGTAYAQEFRWNFANGFAPTEYQSVAMQKLADEMREKTGGKLDITVHHHGSLFGNPIVLESTRNGLVEMGAELMNASANEDPLWGVDSIPFLVTSYEDAWKLWEATRQPLIEKLAKSGVRLLYAVPWPSQGFFFKKEVTKLSDIAGLTMRAYNPPTTQLAELLGARPVTVQLAETPQAFSTGLIESFNTSPTTAADMGAPKFVSHYLKTDAWLPKLMIFVREDAFQSLPKDMQDQLEATALEVEKWGWEQSERMVAEAEQKLMSEGMTITRPDEAFQADLKAVGAKMTEEWLQRAGEEGRAIVDSLK